MKNLIANFKCLAFLLLVLSFAACEKEAINFDTPDDIVQPPIEPNYDQVVKPAIELDDYQDVFDQMLRDGFRPVWIDAFKHRAGVATGGHNVTMFNVIFEKNTDNLQWASFHGLSGNSYQSKFDEYTNAGFRLEFVESYVQDGNARYAAIFVKKAGPTWSAHHGIKKENFQALFNDKVDQGYRMVNRSIITVDDKKYVTALFDKQNVGSWKSLSGLTTPEMQTEMENNNDLDRPLAYLDVSQTLTSKYTFGPIFNSEPFNNWYAPNGLELDELIDEIAKAKSNGYRTTIVVGYDEYAPVNGNEVYKMKFAATFKK